MIRLKIFKNYTVLLLQCLAQIMPQLESSKTQEIALKNELENVDLSGINITRSVIHPKAEFLFKFTQQKVTEELGPEFKVSKDIAEFVFYVFPFIESNEIAMCALIYDMMLFILDDHMDKFPNGEKNIF